MDDFSKALESFRAASEESVLAHYARNEFTFAVPGVEIGKGRKYIKLWSTETRGDETRVNSIHSFVGVETGDIFMPAGINAPAKHARGNIYQNDGRDSLSATGSVRYLR